MLFYRVVLLTVFAIRTMLSLLDLKKSFLHYVDCINTSKDTVKEWPHLLIDFNNLKLICPSCSQSVVTSIFFNELSIVPFVEVSPSLMDIIEFHEYSVKALRALQAVWGCKKCEWTFKNTWIYIDDLLLTKKTFPSFAEIKQFYAKSWISFCYINSTKTWKQCFLTQSMIQKFISKLMIVTKTLKINCQEKKDLC